MRKRLIAIPYLGGKGKFFSKLLSLLPPHDKYVEVFGGGASLLLNKQPVSIEVYNDLDHALYDFFKVLSDPALFEQFYRRVAVLPCSRQLYYECLNTWQEQQDLIERVWRWFVVSRQSFGGRFGAGWRHRIAEPHRGMSGACSQWLSGIESLPQIHARLQRVQIENLDFRKCLEKYRGPGWFAYCDPPYIPETRRAGGYRFEMSVEDHRDLVEMLLDYDGSVVLSCYDHEVYQPLREAGWERFEFEVSCYVVGRTRYTGILGKNATIKKGQCRKEVVYRKIAEEAAMRLI